MAMIRRLGLLLSLLPATLALASCDFLADTPESDWPEPAPALWHVTSPEGEEAWLFGTIHALPDGVQWRTPAIDDALDDAGLVVVEIANLGDVDSALGAFDAVAHSAGLPLLTRRGDEADRVQIERLLDQADVTNNDFADTETWAAALILASAVRVGDPANGVDRAILAGDVPAIGLESFAGQYALFDSLTEEAQVSLLLSVAEEAAAEDRTLGARAWLSGDLAGLDAMGDGGMLADEELREVLVLSRNRAWADRIEYLLIEGREPFVAVGAGHMLGEEGLPALLAARGHAVERLQ